MMTCGAEILCMMAGGGFCEYWQAEGSVYDGRWS